MTGRIVHGHRYRQHVLPTPLRKVPLADHDSRKRPICVSDEVKTRWYTIYLPREQIKQGTSFVILDRATIKIVGLGPRALPVSAPSNVANPSFISHVC
jgi:hypothetical protein